MVTRAPREGHICHTCNNGWKFEINSNRCYSWKEKFTKTTDSSHSSRLKSTSIDFEVTAESSNDSAWLDPIWLPKSTSEGQVWSHGNIKCKGIKGSPWVLWRPCVGATRFPTKSDAVLVGVWWRTSSSVTVGHPKFWAWPWALPEPCLRSGLRWAQKPWLGSG
jgi:hypothetical protein